MLLLACLEEILAGRLAERCELRRGELARHDRRRGERGKESWRERSSSGTVTSGVESSAAADGDEGARFEAARKSGCGRREGCVRERSVQRGALLSGLRACCLSVELCAGSRLAACSAARLLHLSRWWCGSLSHSLRSCPLAPVGCAALRFVGGPAKQWTTIRWCATRERVEPTDAVEGTTAQPHTYIHK